MRRSAACRPGSDRIAIEVSRGTVCGDVAPSRLAALTVAVLDGLLRHHITDPSADGTDTIEALIELLQARSTDGPASAKPV